MNFKNAWTGNFITEEINSDCFLCVAINGKHGVEGAYAALRIGDQIIGTPDRAVSYPSNVWENEAAGRDSNYTYYFPMKKNYEGKSIELVVLGFNENQKDLKIDVWQTAHNAPYVIRKLVLQ